MKETVLDFDRDTVRVTAAGSTTETDICSGLAVGIIPATHVF
ncbi:MAG TPA: hypothetical protein VGI19_17975 [Candidatus Cybelea sp.]